VVHVATVVVVAVVVMATTVVEETWAWATPAAADQA
jgi:hypothetical protein